MTTNHTKIGDCISKLNGERHRAQNQQVAKLGQSINFLYSKLMPNLQKEVGILAGDLIRAFDSAFAKQDQFDQGVDQQQQPQQQQPQHP